MKPGASHSRLCSKEVGIFGYLNATILMLQAADALSTRPSVAGQAYFITNDDAQPFWRFLGDFLEPLGYGRPRIKLPFYPILLLAMIFEYLVRSIALLPQSLRRITTILL